MTTRVNHVTVWLLVFAQQAVGFIWYSSALCGEPGARRSGTRAFAARRRARTDSPAA
jgi:hypothetical protein